jgi:hypothetical protein
LVAETAVPLWLAEAFQAETTFWSPSAKFQVTVQPDQASPVFFKVTSATKPPPQEDVTA